MTMKQDIIHKGRCFMADQVFKTGIDRSLRASAINSFLTGDWNKFFVECDKRFNFTNDQLTQCYSDIKYFCLVN